MPLFVTPKQLALVTGEHEGPSGGHRGRDNPGGQGERQVAHLPRRGFREGEAGGRHRRGSGANPTM